MKRPTEIQWEFARKHIKKEKEWEATKSDLEILFICEFSSSNRKRVETVERMSMFDSRLRNSTFCAIEKKNFQRIATEDILRKFSKTDRILGSRFFTFLERHRYGFNTWQRPSTSLEKTECGR